MKKIISVILLVVCVATMFTGCVTEADRVNHNMTLQAGEFACERKVTVYNAIKHEILLEVEGYMDISNNGANELVVTCKVGPNEYKKNYIYLNQFVLYTVEDITGTHADPYHYHMIFHTNILPTVEVKP